MNRIHRQIEEIARQMQSKNRIITDAGPLLWYEADGDLRPGVEVWTEAGGLEAQAPDGDRTTARGKVVSVENSRCAGIRDRDGKPLASLSAKREALDFGKK